jgi:hypothetical protein
VTGPDASAPASDLEGIARSAARAYWTDQGLPGPERIDDPPVLGPVTLPAAEGSGERVAFRFIGPGRGSDYVQVEVDLAARTATVHGALGGDQLPTRRLPL